MKKFIMISASLLLSLTLLTSCSIAIKIPGLKVNRLGIELSLIHIFALRQPPDLLSITAKWEERKLAELFMNPCHRLNSAKKIKCGGVWLIAVSYTHLDVYKRQALCLSRALKAVKSLFDSGERNSDILKRCV